MNTTVFFTPGEPAGIGPDIAVMIAQEEPNQDLVVVADPDLLRKRARILNLPITIKEPSNQALRAGELKVMPVPLTGRQVVPGTLAPVNADYVLECLRRAVANLNHAALVTGPVHKGVINQAGIDFSGHTEFLQELSKVKEVVMMLGNDKMKVALATTHLPLSDVPSRINSAMIAAKLAILHAALRRDFALPKPKILVAGLNPHAGEGGYLGREELDFIKPVVSKLRGQGVDISGPLPADTMFKQAADAYFTMYHDQGLPVVKYAHFGNCANFTLGLPYIRTSVDHGVALKLAATGKINLGSARYAIRQAGVMLRNRV